MRDATLLFDPDTAEARNFAVLPIPLRDNLLSIDPPDHTRLRRLVGKACTVREVEALRPSIERIVDELLDDMTGIVDLMAKFATVLPVKVVCALLGVPEVDSPTMLAWTQTMVSLSFLEALPLHTNENVSAFYDVCSHILLRIWDDNFHYGYWECDADESSNRVAALRMTDLMIEKIGVGPGDRVLDLGCGIGVPALTLVDTTCADVVGISINQAQVDEANRRAAGRASFVCADALALPFDRAEFDAAWAFESLLHMDRVAALRELARVVRQGGHIVVADIIQTGPLSEESKAALGPALETFALSPVPTIDDYRVLFAEAGLEVVELTDVSEHTKKTMPRLVAGARQHHDELVAAYGEEARAYLDVLLSPIASLPEWGYLVAVAVRP